MGPAKEQELDAARSHPTRIAARKVRYLLLTSPSILHTVERSGAKSVVASMLRTGDFDDEVDEYIAWRAQQRTINRAIQNEAAPQYTSVYYGSLAKVE
jgi:CHAD domain-containing protein